MDENEKNNEPENKDEGMDQAQQQADNVPTTVQAVAASNEVKLPPMFLSSYLHSVDQKGRLIIPAAYRSGLGNSCVVAPSLDFESIAVYPPDVWQREIDRLYLKSQKSVAVAGRILEQFSTYSYPNIEPDQQGRILLPARIRQLYLGDAKEVVVAGKINHVLIKSQTKADTQDKEFDLIKGDLLKQLDMIDG